MNNSLLLKEQTKMYHDNVERVMNSTLLFSNQFTIDHYKYFISQSHRYVNSLLTISAIDWPQFYNILNIKNEALTLDLSHLQINKTKNIEIKQNTKFYNLGLIYIVLGAMLGNKIIIKKLTEQSQFNNFPFAYLREHQDQLPEIWNNFQQEINQLTAEDLNEVINGAIDGYSLFGRSDSIQ